MSPQVFGELQLSCSLDFIINISLIFLATALTLLLLETAKQPSGTKHVATGIFKRPKSVSAYLHGKLAWNMSTVFKDGFNETQTSPDLTLWLLPAGLFSV